MGRSPGWGAIAFLSVALAGGATAGLTAALLLGGETASYPVADGFLLPFGDGTDAAVYRSRAGTSYDGWYVAAGFLDQTYERDHGALHPGEDWNGNGGGDTDLGQPVLAAGCGRVEAIDKSAPGWGNVVMLGHRLASGEKVFTVYGHVENVAVHVGDVVRRGETLAVVGKGDRDRYWAHLHFEVRRANMAHFRPSFWPSAHGYDAAWIRAHYYAPRKFIEENRATTPLVNVASLFPAGGVASNLAP